MTKSFEANLYFGLSERFEPEMRLTAYPLCSFENSGGIVGSICKTTLN